MGVTATILEFASLIELHATDEGASLLSVIGPAELVIPGNPCLGTYELVIKVFGLWHT